MTRMRIAEEWTSFSEAVIPKFATAGQRRQMRNSFYAGASAAMAIVSTHLCSETSDEDGAKMLRELFDELKAFVDGMREEAL